MTVNTNLLMQMLAGGSQALLQGKPMVEGINPITQQQIQNQSYTGMLQKILGGGGKMTLDKDKFSITGSPTLLSENGANPVGSGDPTSQGYGGTPQAQVAKAGPVNQGMPMPGQSQSNVMNSGQQNNLLQMLLGGGTGGANFQGAL